MRHKNLLEAHAAAAWPNTMEGLVLAERAEVRTDLPSDTAPLLPTPAAADVAAGVGGLIVGVYAALLMVFFAFFAGSLTSLFVITICTGFVAVFFAVPRIFFAIEPDQSRRPSLPAFMDKGMETLTGHSTGRDALVQMLIVPVLLTFGLLAMGIIGKVFL